VLQRETPIDVLGRVSAVGSAVIAIATLAGSALATRSNAGEVTYRHFAAEIATAATSDAGTIMVVLRPNDETAALRAEIPGIKPAELSISALRNRVSISGKREIPREHDRVSYHRKERPEGGFNRAVTLPTEVDAERVDARYADGILTLTLPKAAQAKPRQIAVKT